MVPWLALQLVLDLIAVGAALWLLRAAGRRTRREEPRTEQLARLRAEMARALGEAEERGRDLERALAARERSLRALLRELEARQARAETGPSASQAPRQALAAEVKRLTGAGLGVAEIARRLCLDPAGVRLLQDCEVDLR